MRTVRPPRPVRVPLLVSGGAAVAAVLGACGPSFQAIYEGNARFEHCYALEERPNVGMPEKADCWRDWSERYTYGQTRDRIQYATARYVALSQAPALPTDEAMMMAAPGVTPRVTTITAPTPTNAFEPPPKVLDVAAAARGPTNAGALPAGPPDAGAAPAPPPPPLPGSSCSDGCAGSYRDCGDGCDDDDADTRSAKEKKRCESCKRSYKTCMRACFK